MSLHHELKAKIETHYGEQLDREPVLMQDSLQLYFDNGLSMELRYINSNEYSLQWAWGDVELRIDTAPMHKDLATFPNHLHDADANLRSDPVTSPGSEPWDNIRQLIERLLKDPLLESN